MRTGTAAENRHDDVSTQCGLSENHNLLASLPFIQVCLAQWESDGLKCILCGTNRDSRLPQVLCSIHRADKFFLAKFGLPGTLFASPATVSATSRFLRDGPSSNLVCGIVAEAGTFSLTVSHAQPSKVPVSKIPLFPSEYHTRYPSESKERRLSRIMLSTYFTDGLVGTSSCVSFWNSGQSLSTIQLLGIPIGAEAGKDRGRGL